MSKTICKGCGYTITWAEQRQQFGRLIRAGLSPDEAKAVQPRCQRCVTRWLRTEQAVGATETHDDAAGVTGEPSPAGTPAAGQEPAGFEVLCRGE